MIKLTVVCREAGYSDILLYTVQVANPDDYLEVKHAVQTERNRDLGDEAQEVELIVAFQGDIAPRVDWRD